MSMRIHLLTIIALLLTISSCKKYTSTELASVDGKINGSIKMKLNGQDWIADKISNATIMGGTINISAQNAEGQLLTISLHDTSARKYMLVNDISLDSLHSAAFADTGALSIYPYGTNEGRTRADAGGWVMITNVNKPDRTISGSFQVKMFREMDGSHVIINDGSFENMKYETSLPLFRAIDSLKVKIDGGGWSPANIVSVSANGLLSIVANESPANKMVTLRIPSNITAGTYNLDVYTGKYVGIYNPVQTSALASVSGKIKVIEHNTTTKRIRGYFNFNAKAFTGTSSANLTDGYFSVTYQ